MSLREHCPTVEDLRLTRDPDYLPTLFRKPAYRAEAEWILLDPAELECPDLAGIRRCFLLADHAHLPGLQVLLFELDAVRTANMRLLARDLIVVGHRCITHDDTDALRAAVEGTTLEERVWYAAGRRQSSVIWVTWGYFDGSESFVSEGLTYQ